MPRAISAFGTGPGFARYQLNGDEEFTIQAASVLTVNANVTPYYYVHFICDDAAGNGIYRQFLGIQTRGGMGFYLAQGGADMYGDNSAAQGFPQNSAKYGNGMVNLTIPEITLTPGCTVGFYVESFFLQPGTPPSQYLIADPNNVAYPHLWVEDRTGRRDVQPELPPDPEPLLTTVAV